MFDELRRVLSETSGLLARDGAASDASLEFRTGQLAKVYAPEATGELLRVLVCQIGPERYGWPVTNVHAIARTGRLTPVPSAPPFYRGVTSLRGQVLSVMDLRVYFGLPPSEKIPELLVVIGGPTLEIGVLADDLFDVIALRPGDLIGPGLEPELIRGITLEGLSLIDAEALLAREWRRVKGEEAH